MIVTRFAPSPTGLLHLGHAFASLKASETAKRAGGRFILRHEDIDQARSKPDYERTIEDDLAWLGLEWERPVRRQSEYFSDYANALAVLDAKGLLYPCFCTRKEIADEISRASTAPHGPEGPIYPGTCRTLTLAERATRKANTPYALRLDVTKAERTLSGPLTFDEQGQGPSGETGRQTVQPGLFGDVVLARKDMPASYHLAVVVDDALQGVTLVTRGEDLFAATHIQRLLQALLGLPTPSYAHHTLVLDAAGKKFSKRDSAVTLHSLRAGGATPDDIRRMICFT